MTPLLEIRKYLWPCCLFFSLSLYSCFSQNCGRRPEELSSPAEYVSHHHVCNMEHYPESQPTQAYPPPATLLPQNPYTQHPTNDPMYSNTSYPARAPFTFPTEQSVWHATSVIALHWGNTIAPQLLSENKATLKGYASFPTLLPSYPVSFIKAPCHDESVSNLWTWNPVYCALIACSTEAICCTTSTCAVRVEITASLSSRPHGSLPSTPHMCPLDLFVLTASHLWVCFLLPSV